MLAHPETSLLEGQIERFNLLLTNSELMLLWCRLCPPEHGRLEEWILTGVSQI